MPVLLPAPVEAVKPPEGIEGEKRRRRTPKSQVRAH
jgi:hypothetical protein